VQTSKFGLSSPSFSPQGDQLSREPAPPPFAPRTEADAVSFEVLVVPRASRSRVIGVHAGRLKVTLAAPRAEVGSRGACVAGPATAAVIPVDGEANAELCVTLAKALGVPRRAVSITHGEHNKHKTVRVNGATAEQVFRLSQSSPA